MKIIGKKPCPYCGRLIQKHRIIENGDFYFLYGKSTRIMVVDTAEKDHKIRCLVVKASPYSKYKEGRKYYFNRRLLHPRKNKKR